jgi:hypothetical protein
LDTYTGVDISVLISFMKLVGAVVGQKP